LSTSDRRRPRFLSPTSPAEGTTGGRILTFETCETRRSSGSVSSSCAVSSCSGTPELQVFVVTKDELRGWIRAFEWMLGESYPSTKGS